MRQSRLLGRTLREAPKDAQTAAHALLLRAGFIQQLSAGVYNYLPLLVRTLNKISQIIREKWWPRARRRCSCLRCSPRSFGRDQTMGTLHRGGRHHVRLQGPPGRHLLPRPTHEEVITDILRREIKSYKDLPRCAFQIQTKFRDEIRPRFGLMRAREFIMKDAYSFDADEAGWRPPTRRNGAPTIASANASAFATVPSKPIRAPSAAPAARSSWCSRTRARDDSLLRPVRLRRQPGAGAIAPGTVSQETGLKPMEAVFGEGLIASNRSRSSSISRCGKPPRRWSSRPTTRPLP